MRILLTTDTIGGVWTFTRELSEQLLSRGHAIALVSFGRSPSTAQRSWVDSAASRFGERFSFVASELALEWMQENKTVFQTGSELLRDVVDSFSPDVIHSNQLCWGALLLKVARLVTAHSDVSSWAAACAPGGLPDSAWLSRYKVLVQAGLHGASAVAAPTAWMRDALQTSFDVPCRLDVIPNGRSLPHVREPEERILQAVSVGRLWDPAKGLSTLLEVQSPLPICLAGEQEFEGTSCLLGSAPIRMLGHLGEQELFKLFCNSAIYVAASVYEPFGLAPLEAALCGCAIVARDLPSFREVWQEAALYFQTSTELEQLLHRLAWNPAALRACQRASRERAAGFTAERMAHRYLALYEQTLTPPVESSHSVSQEFAEYAA